MKLLYFAWIRERTGVHEEDYDLPDNVTTLAELMDHLATRGPGFADAFSDQSVIRAAVNQEMVKPGHMVAQGDEVGFFPPMTGG